MSALHQRTACLASTSGRHPCTSPRVCFGALNPRPRGRQLRALAGETTRRPDEEYMKEYQGLKDQLYDNTRKCGAVVAAYLLLTVDGQAALCALLGSAASYAYLTLLYRDVDSYKGDTVVPMVVADQIENTLLRRVAKVGCAYRQALQPRLMVPVGLALLAAGYNRVTGPEGPSLDLLHQGCLLLGFLSYKAALVIKVVDDLTPKTFTDASDSRPRVEPIEDELDMFGRPKRRMVRMPTEALPEGVEPEKMPLAGLILAAEGEADGQGEGVEKARRAGEGSPASSAVSGPQR